MSVENIVKRAKDKVAEMGGGEQFIGKMDALATECKLGGVDLILGLGEALEKEGLQLISGVGAPEDLYASPLEV